MLALLRHFPHVAFVPGILMAKAYHSNLTSRYKNTDLITYRPQLYINIIRVSLNIRFNFQSNETWQKTCWNSVIYWIYIHTYIIFGMQKEWSKIISIYLRSSYSYIIYFFVLSFYLFTMKWLGCMEKIMSSTIHLYLYRKTECVG